MEKQTMVAVTGSSTMGYESPGFPLTHSTPAAVLIRTEKDTSTKPRANEEMNLDLNKDIAVEPSYFSGGYA